jgi:hypothetical protein
MPPRRQLFTYIPLAHIKPIVCLRCGEKARAVWHSPLPAGLKGEMRTFECDGCGKKMKLIVEETEPQEGSRGGAGSADANARQRLQSALRSLSMVRPVFG